MALAFLIPLPPDDEESEMQYFTYSGEGIAHFGKHPVFDEILASQEYRRAEFWRRMYRDDLYGKSGYDSWAGKKIARRRIWWGGILHDKCFAAINALSELTQHLMEKHQVSRLSMSGAPWKLAQLYEHIPRWGGSVERSMTSWRRMRSSARARFHEERGNAEWAAEHRIRRKAIDLDEMSWPLTPAARARTIRYLRDEDMKAVERAREAEREEAERVKLAALREFLEPFFLGRGRLVWKKGFTDEALAYVAAQVEGLEWVTRYSVSHMAGNFYEEREREDELA